MRSFSPPGRAVGLLVLAWLAVSARVWAWGETFYLRDFWTNYLPARVSLREAFAEGRWPLWNQWIGGGLPAAPDPAASLFYFPGWPFLALGDQAWSLSVLVSLHLLVAALGTWALARRTLKPTAAFTAAVVFAFGGLLISNQINAHFQYAYCLLPAWWWALLGALDATDSPGRWRFGGALAGVWGLQLLAPDPQTAYLEGLGALVALLGTQLEARDGWPGFRRRLGLVVAAALVATLLAAPQLLAFIEALGQTDRGGMTDAESTTWSLPPARAWELVLPLPFGELTPETTFWASTLVGKTWANFYFSSLYVGALALPLALLGASRLGPRARVFAAGAAVLTATAMGTTLPLYVLARHALPVWGAFRYPERLVVIPLLGLAFLIGLGFERLLEPEVSRRARAMLALPAALALLAWGWPGVLGAGAVSASAVADSVVPAALHTLGFSALAVLVLLSRLPRGPALAGVVTLDLLLAASTTQATWVPPADVPAPITTSARVLMPLSDVSEATAKMPPKPALRRAFEDALARPNLNAVRGMRTTNAVTSLVLRRASVLRNTLGPEAAATLYETGYLLGRPGLALKDFSPERALADGLVLYRATTQPSPVTCTGLWLPVPSMDQAAEAVARREIPVESEQAPAQDGEGAVPCEVTRPRSGALVVRLEPSKRPVLVSPSESYYPGWEVRFDEGGWQDPVATRVAFLGAIAPPSTSTVEFRFAPRWFAPSLGLASLAWVLWAFAVSLTCRRRS